ncbi:viroplasmin family protein [Shewanella sp. 6_MG-2023]|uniref:ribonuclease H1 domain-containing protein n=1 Tax=Shewanella sp. 6_MG-2023 TaxID=3062660 RepID=UPI0026E27FF9|nr:viroplasmin family protein [Shewanella sp. 6_MG-2023]MDO6620237.1 viroplasmin family protein [Shewanella sp. 6_MG-2023]
MKKFKQKLKSHFPYYVVPVGSETGIFDSFHKARKSYENYPHGRCEGFHTLKGAQDALNRHANALRDSNAEFHWGPTPPPRGNNC